jgi:hypothetical protein
MQDQIADLAISYDFWVFGGWCRDVVCRGVKTARDVDIMVPASQAHRVDHFIQMLSLINRDAPSWKEVEGHYFTTTQYIKKVIKIQVGSVEVDLCLYDGELDDWKSEYTCDLSCNLFYMSREVPIGIRYIPPHFKNLVNPMKKIIEMTRKGEFMVIHEPAGLSIEQHVADREERKIKYVIRRALRMCNRGWRLVAPIASDDIRKWMDEVEGLRLWVIDMEEQCEDVMIDRQVDALEDATGLPEEVLDEVRRHLDF